MSQTIEQTSDIGQSIEAQVFKLFRSISNYVGMFTMNTEGIITIISGDFTREVAEIQGMYILDIIHDMKGILDVNSAIASQHSNKPELLKRIVLNYGAYSLSIVVVNSTIYVAKFSPAETGETA